VTTCAFEGCGRKREKREWCGTHYSRWRKHGDPHVYLKVAGPPKPCRAEGCERFVGDKGAKGLCSLHYGRLKAYGDPHAEIAVGEIPPWRIHGPTCSVPECDRPTHAHGWCSTHVGRYYRLGTVALPGNLSLPHVRRRDKAPMQRRFWAKVKKSDGCWEWTASRHPSGHGYLMNDDGKVDYAHRVSWVLHFGPISEGYQINHDCNNAPCVRPDHLYLGTQRENVHDMLRATRNIVAPAQRSML